VSSFALRHPWCPPSAPRPSGTSTTAARGQLADRRDVVALEGRGPAAARDAGWRAAPPVEATVFLDDDVLVGPRWHVARFVGGFDTWAGCPHPPEDG
jgi:hypothetical protein